MDKRLALEGLDVHEHLRDSSRKQNYVNTVFQTIASSYDRFTRLSSLGLDMAWKRELLGLVKARLRRDYQVLDLATGTGDLAFALAARVRRGRVIGVDIAENMIHLAEQARRQRKVTNVEFHVGDMIDLRLPPASIDAITVSYGLRNCPDLRRALSEIYRVLKPGGVLASLDFVRPQSALWERTFLKALLTSCNFFGWLWHREPAVYAYLPHSIAHFISIRELSRALTDAGFEVLVQRPRLNGMIAIHLARKKICGC
ncbi:MAG TPA: ubiquinone/menaquinone biosynthesis methyltransferase [Gemmataceae bacterium]|nr:ubiquinone/menaquinone biosynthesis methyltransferase [Gemmataceae bacterium]